MAAAFAPWRDEIVTFGGFSFQFTNEVHAFHVESKTWKKLELNGKPPERRNAAAALICGKKMFVYGGYSISGYPLGDLWIADLSNSMRPSWSLAQAPNGYFYDRVGCRGWLLGTSTAGCGATACRLWLWSYSLRGLSLL